MKRWIAGLLLSVFLLSKVAFAEETPPAEPPPEPAALPPLVISEIAWMGTEASGTDEWVELFNASENPIDLAGWRLQNSDSSLNVALSGLLEPGAFFVLERTDESTINDQTASQIYTGALRNSNESLRLLDPTGAAIDSVDSWIAGDSERRASMERVDASAWCTNDEEHQNGMDAGGHHVHGTPGQPRGCEPPQEEPVEETPPEPSLPRIVINEISPNPKTADGLDEFIEIYNADSRAVDLRGWELDDELLDNDQSYFFADEEKNYWLDPGQFMVLYAAETWLSLGDNGDSVYLFDPEGNEVDHYDYAPEVAGASWGRDATNPENWLAFRHPTPGALNLENNAAPVAVIRLQQDTAHMSVNVTGEDSADPDGDDLTYLWEFEPGITGAEKNPARYTYSEPGPKEVRLTVTDPFGVSQMTAILFNAEPKPEGSARAATTAAELTPAEPATALPITTAYPAGSLRFIKALPNPEGDDAGKEKIVLKNTSAQPIDLNQWALADKKAEQKLAAHVVAPGAEITLTGNDFRLNLNNADEALTLKDPAGNTIDAIAWDSSKSGQWVPNQTGWVSGMRARVVRVIDGDTFEIDLNGAAVTVRLLGVDAPESVHPFKAVEAYGKAAADFLKNLLTGQSVTIAFDDDKTDSYGRMLAYVELAGKSLNETLLQEGLARAYTRFSFQKKQRYVELEKAAQKARRGLWQTEGIETQMDQAPKDDAPPPEEPEAAADPACDSPYLKIESVSPSPKAAGAQEFIRLINTGPDEICLTGWRLDDMPEIGSKPFTIQGGSIAPGGERTFRGPETGLKLNNGDDCATLLNPLGALADQLCYQKTHADETFTHAGGDYVAPAKKPKASRATKIRKAKLSAKKPATTPAISRERTAMQSDLSNTTLVGTIVSVEPKTRRIILASQGQKITVDYSEKTLDWSMAEALIDLTKPVVLHVRASEKASELVSIEQPWNEAESVCAESPAQNPFIRFFPWLLALLLGAAFLRLKFLKVR